MSDKLERLKGLLRELFQLDQPDLDFGIYRIMHAKSAEVTQFLDNELLPQVRAAFEQYRPASKAEIQSELDEAIEQARGLGVDPETTQKVQDLRRKLADDAVDLDALEAEVYDHLYHFFRRYYSEGDFLAKRVYKPGVYAIPYEGEEVKLHWANKDQYYIKTGEYLRDYAFKLRPHDEQNPMRVHFRLVDATEGEHGNVKATNERRFILAPAGESGRDFIAIENGDLIIRFQYRPATLSDWPAERRAEEQPKNKPKLPAQADLTGFAAERVLELADEELQTWITELQRPHVKADGTQADYSRLVGHLNRYSARNTFDYFIHKDLGGFLRRELDFFIKNEIMHLDDVESETAPRVEQYLSKIRVIRRIAHKIIVFLAQLEEFQKKLWLKKKFVVETNYCITLDCVPEALFPDIIANEHQIRRWVETLSIDEIAADTLGKHAYSRPLSVDFLRQNKYLPLDTTLFSESFKASVLAALSDLDPRCCGVVVQSDSLQAIRLMTHRTGPAVHVLIADPPYNIGSDGFPYKDNYQHSTWLAFLHDFLGIAHRLMPTSALAACFIDDHEAYRLGLLMNEVFGEANRAACAPWKSESSGGKEKTGLRTGHEYLLIYHNGDSTCVTQTEISTGALNLNDKWGAYRKGRELRKWGGASARSDRPGQWFSLTAPDGTEVLPIKNDGTEGHWRWGRNNAAVKAALQDSEVFHWEKCGFDKGVVYGGQATRWVPFEKIRDTKKSVGWTTWLDGIGTNADATRELKGLFGVKPFETPKPTSLLKWLLSLHAEDSGIVLDLFAGSGTAAHAVLDGNREDDARRKFIVGDCAECVWRVIWPRIQKALYSSEWSDGKPRNRDTGMSGIVKIITLESYEDALNALDIRLDEAQQGLLAAPGVQGTDGLKEQYYLRYMLDVETRGSASLLNVDAFIDPTAYRLKVRQPGSDDSREMNVDLLETFNWLIGLTVQHIAAPQTLSAEFERDAEGRLQIEGRLRPADGGPWWFRTVTGTTPDGKNTLVIWRKRPGGDTPEGLEQDNLVLNEWFSKSGYSTKDYEFDLIYVNGDNNLENLKTPEDTWKVRLIEEDFHRLMFDVEDV